MQVGNLRPLELARLRFIVALCMLIFISGTTIRAQKTPPILKDNESSAFNREQIKVLRDRAIAGNTDDARLARNRLIAVTVEQVDTAFNDYRKKSRKRTDALSFLFDFLEIGASSAISIMNGERGKTLVGEGLSLFQGSRAAFNKDFRFLERQILFDKMVADRSLKLTEIYKKLGLDTNAYSWEQARQELREYFFAGTIDEALSSLSRDTGTEATEAIKTLAKVTPGQVELSKTYAQRLAELFTAAKGSNLEAAGAALTKLKAALKNNLDLTPAGTTAVAIDNMTVAQVEQLYRDVGLFLLDHPDRLEKLNDALK